MEKSRIASEILLCFCFFTNSTIKSTHISENVFSFFISFFFFLILKNELGQRPQSYKAPKKQKKKIRVAHLKSNYNKKSRTVGCPWKFIQRQVRLNSVIQKCAAGGMAKNHQSPCVPSRYWLKICYTKIHVALSQGGNTNHLKRTATHDSLSARAVITCNRGSGAPDARATIHVRHLTSGPMGSTC